jgi:hypothetical protein
MKALLDSTPGYNEEDHRQRQIARLIKQRQDEMMLVVNEEAIEDEDMVSEPVFKED